MGRLGGQTMTVYINNNKLQTKLYKKNYRQQAVGYLLYSIEHQLYVKNCIPYAQAIPSIRYKRILEDPTILADELKNLKQSFISRYYRTNIIDAALNRVTKPNRGNLINYNIK